MWAWFATNNCVPPQPATAVFRPRTRYQAGCRGPRPPPPSCIWLLSWWCPRRRLAASWAGGPGLSGWGGPPALESGSLKRSKRQILGLDLLIWPGHKIRRWEAKSRTPAGSGSGGLGLENQDSTVIAHHATVMYWQHFQFCLFMLLFPHTPFQVFNQLSEQLQPHIHQLVVRDFRQDGSFERLQVRLLQKKQTKKNSYLNSFHPAGPHSWTGDYIGLCGVTRRWLM